MAIVTERTVGIAMGIPPMSKTRRLSMPGRYGLFWIPYITIISINIPIAIEQMQKLPIEVKTCNHKNKKYICIYFQKILNVFSFISSNEEVLGFHLLEVPHMIGVLDKMSCFTEESMNSGCYNNCFDFSLFAC